MITKQNLIRDKQHRMNRIDTAVKLFEEGFSCSQAILAAYASQFGIETEQALKLAAGFGGGIGCMGRLCGALSGVFMVIGLKYGAADATDKDAKLKTYELVNTAAEMFEERTGQLDCRDLLSFDLSTPRGKEQAKREGSFEICPKLVKDAAKILEEILSANVTS